ncbi:MAG: TIGR02710 family CRISPR-associated CARF protein [Blastocatellia bacterium]
MYTNLIISVGGTEAPIVKSIGEHKPKYICFLCSQKTVELIPNIRKMLVEQFGDDLPSFKDHKIILDDENDLIHCYQKARECIGQLEAWGVAAADTVVDYTGGTKQMSVALGLATVKEGYEFSYIGGDRRSKAGVGIVLDGAEVVRAGINPWSLYAVDDKKLLAKYFNRHQFLAAKEICDTLANKQVLDDSLKGFFKVISQLCTIYDLWDKFQHLEALKQTKNAFEQLTNYFAFNRQVKYQQFVSDVQANFDRLKQLSADTNQFKKASQSLITDLIANAERRATENKYDDAVARLYRSLEMVAQVAITEEPLKVTSASDFPKDKLPDSLKDDYIQHYERDGKIKLGMEALFRVLNAIEPPHPHAQTFFAYFNELRNVQNARNQSILAHGLTPVEVEKYERLSTILCKRMNLGNLVEFAKLPEE